MSLFFITFFTTFALMHLYFFMKLRRCFRLGRTTQILILLNLAILVFSPLFARLAVRDVMLPWAYILSYTAYTWLAFLFLFCSTALVMDTGGMLLWACRKAGIVRKKQWKLWRKMRRAPFLIPLFVAAAACLYGYFEALDIRTETITLASSKITPAQGRIRIAQITDVHLSPTMQDDRFERIIRAVEKAAPDIIVSTGDLVDAPPEFLAGRDKRLRALHPRLGKYAICGNHEFYWGLDDALRFTEDAGFRMLRGEAVGITDDLIIAGIDDPAGSPFKSYRPVPETKLLSALKQDRFILFLKHRPLAEPASVGLFDLQLSGHTHKGQIFPFSILTWVYYPRHAGMLHLLNGSFLYVSRGSGTWGPPIRLLAPPEVTVIDLVPAAKQ